MSGLGFPNYVSDRLAAIDFEALYNKIYNDETYCPSELVEIIVLTTYFLDNNGRLTSPITHTLGYYRGLMEDNDRTPLKAELLFIVAKCYELVMTKNKSPNFPSGMYL